jgi:hypothetical protein
MHKVRIDCRVMGHTNSREGSFRGAVFGMLAKLEPDDRVEVVGAVDARGFEIGRYVQRVRSYVHEYNKSVEGVFSVQNRFGRLIVERIA